MLVMYGCPLVQTNAHVGDSISLSFMRKNNPQHFDKFVGIFVGTLPSCDHSSPAQRRNALIYMDTGGHWKASDSFESRPLRHNYQALTSLSKFLVGILSVSKRFRLLFAAYSTINSE